MKGENPAKVEESPSLPKQVAAAKPKKVEGKGLLNTLTHETMAGTMGRLIKTDADSQKKQMSTTF